MSHTALAGGKPPPDAVAEADANAHVDFDTNIENNPRAWTNTSVKSDDFLEQDVTIVGDHYEASAAQIGTLFTSFCTNQGAVGTKKVTFARGSTEGWCKYVGLAMLYQPAVYSTCEPQPTKGYQPDVVEDRAECMKRKARAVKKFNEYIDRADKEVRRSESHFAKALNVLFPWRH